MNNMAVSVAAECVAVAEDWDDGWHPLSGVPAPEYIPPKWEPEHVATRMIDGFKAIAMAPLGHWARSYPPAALWPDIPPDEFDQYFRNTAVPRSHKRPGRIRGRPVRATAEQLRIGETALGWACWLWHRHPFSSFAVVEFATYYGVPFERDEGWEYLYLAQPPRAFHIAQALLQHGLMLIARNLNAIGLPVF